MKRGVGQRSSLLPALLVALMLLGGFIPLLVKAADPTLVRISPSSQTVSAGQTFTVNVSCTPGRPIKSFEFKVSFNASLLQANTVTEGNMFQGYTTFFNAGTINNSAGTIIDVYGLILGPGTVSAPGTFVSLSFTAASASGTSAVTLYGVGVTNETMYLPITVTNGSVILREYSLGVTLDGQGSVVKNPNQATYTYGTVVQLTATADTGWTFSSWGGDLSGSANPASVTMNGNRSVTAYFTQNQCTLTVTLDGSGSVTKNPDLASYAYGTVVTVNAVPATGWVFSSWSGDLSGSTNPTTITMTTNKAITAHFTQNHYTLTITLDGSGSVTKSPDNTTYSYGEVVTLTGVPDSGWVLSSWSGDLSGSQNPKTITMNGNKSVTAHFSDAAAPQISSVVDTTSDPLDTDPLYGWVNVSCTVTDNVAVSQVLLRIHNPGGSWNNVSMTSSGAGGYYYRSSTAFSSVGNYSYSIWVNDSSNNANTSSTVLFSMIPNWDMNSDGECTIFDLVLVSNHYGEIGAGGWIREDVDNNGEVQVFDLVVISNYYGESWW